MPSMVARSTAQNDTVLLELPDVSTDVPYVTTRTRCFTFDTDWYYLTRYEPLNAQDEVARRAFDVHRSLLAGNINRILLDATLIYAKSVFTNVFFFTAAAVGTERLRHWYQAPAEMIAPPAGSALPRRGKALPSEVTEETRRKAQRAGAFFEAVPSRRADEDDPDYGL